MQVALETIYIESVIQTIWNYHFSSDLDISDPSFNAFCNNKDIQMEYIVASVTQVGFVKRLAQLFMVVYRSREN